jgi:hypothetical protein
LPPEDFAVNPQPSFLLSSTCRHPSRSAYRLSSNGNKY